MPFKSGLEVVSYETRGEVRCARSMSLCYLYCGIVVSDMAQ